MEGPVPVSTTRCLMAGCDAYIVDGFCPTHSLVAYADEYGLEFAKDESDPPYVGEYGWLDL